MFISSQRIGYAPKSSSPDLSSICLLPNSERTNAVCESLGVTSVDKLGDLNGRKVLLRVDANFDPSCESLSFHPRARQVVSTLSALLDQGARVVVLSHVSAEEGSSKCQSKGLIVQTLIKRFPELASRIRFCPFYKREIELTGKICETAYFGRIGRRMESLQPGKALFLENVRLFSIDKTGNDDLKLQKAIVERFDAAVLCAFGVSHRDGHFSSDIVFRLFDPRTKALGSAAAFEWLKTIDFTSDAAKGSIGLILGGDVSKFTSKLRYIRRILNSHKVGFVHLGGVFGTAFLKATGSSLGMTRTLEHNDLCAEVRSLVQDFPAVKFNLPDSYHGVSPKGPETWPVKISKQGPTVQIPADCSALDQKPSDFEQLLSEIPSVTRVLVAGPLGYFPKRQFRAGTLESHRSVLQWAGRDSGRKVIFGGGDSLSAVLGDLEFQSPPNNVHLSSGGGALLAAVAELLMAQGEIQIPGLSALRAKPQQFSLDTMLTSHRKL